jgi:hypothetical protein
MIVKLIDGKVVLRYLREFCVCNVFKKHNVWGVGGGPTSDTRIIISRPTPHSLRYTLTHSKSQAPTANCELSTIIPVK